MKKLRRIGSVCFLLLLAFLITGCRDKNDRFTSEALFRKVLVRNGQSAVLKVPDGYVSLVLTTDWNNVAYVQQFSSTGDFSNDAATEAKGTLTNHVLMTFHGVKVWVGDGDADRTWVELDWEDRATGLALSDKVLLNLADTAKLQFRTNTPLTAQDIQRKYRIK